MSIVQKVKAKPTGVLNWVTITGEGKENLSGRMQYTANHVLSPDDSKDLIAEIDAFWKENKPPSLKKAAKSLGYANQTEKTGDEDEHGAAVKKDTGMVEFYWKTGVTFADGSKKKVKTYNSKNREVSIGDKKIGNGSVGCVSGSMGIYEVKSKEGKLVDAGVTLYLNAIMLKKYVEFTQDDGFEADDTVEDGFEGFDEDGDFDEPDSAEPKSQPRL